MTIAAEIAVVGAGAVGLVTALTLARAGRAVTVIDPGRPSSASSVAAGMLAPVAETLLEGGDAESLGRLMAARDLWPGVAAEVPKLEIDRCGAELWPVDGSVVAALRGLGARFELRGQGVFLPDDWRLDPPEALRRLRDAAQDAGAVFLAGEARVGEGGLLAAGRRVAAESLVIASGYGARALGALAPELALLRPIKGQIAVFDAPSGGPTIRAPGVYLAPQPGGLRAGATMEPGLDDEGVDQAAVSALAERAIAQRPSLAGAAMTGAAGVRAETPDGWPMVGPSAAPGVMLAVGARRNGWLLAPMMAQLVADHLAGQAQGPLAAAFHPGRFTR